MPLNKFSVLQQYIIIKETARMDTCGTEEASADGKLKYDTLLEEWSSVLSACW